MAQTNVKSRKTTTSEGARSMTEDPISRLKRVMHAHLLWEDSFYIDGKASAELLQEAVRDAMRSNMDQTRHVILEGRTTMNIRHAPLMAAVTYAREAAALPANWGAEVRALIAGVIRRADEMAEVIAMAGGKEGMTHAMRKGIVDAFGTFDEYQLAKYRGKGKGVSLVDVVRLTHVNPERSPLASKVIHDTLETPNTWETRLSAGEDKKAVFEDLLREGRLGAMALLRNLRGMEEARVSSGLITEALENASWSKVLPFRFLTAALTAPRFAAPLDRAFRKAVAGSPPLPGRTAVLLDTSGSMTSPVSQKSIVRAYQAGAALAAAVNGDVDLYEWAEITRPVANWQSLSTALSIRVGSVGYGTKVGQAIAYAQEHGEYDRLIVVTDMQFSDAHVPGIKDHQVGYTINLSTYPTPGLVHGRWTHLTGFSSATLKYISAAELV